MPVAQVALASGFESLRRFNAAFAERYRFNPTRCAAKGRRAGRSPCAAPGLSPTAGRATALLAFFARRQLPASSRSTA
jgi:AraC family transcriptional regulator of adaptative response / DNA-3-methyladenine glycosylase II